MVGLYWKLTQLTHWLIVNSSPLVGAIWVRYLWIREKTWVSARVQFPHYDNSLRRLAAMGMDLAILIGTRLAMAGWSLVGLVQILCGGIPPHFTMQTEVRMHVFGKMVLLRSMAERFR